MAFISVILLCLFIVTSTAIEERKSHDVVFGREEVEQDNLNSSVISDSWWPWNSDGELDDLSDEKLPWYSWKNSSLWYLYKDLQGDETWWPWNKKGNNTTVGSLIEYFQNWDWNWFSDEYKVDVIDELKRRINEEKQNEVKKSLDRIKNIQRKRDRPIYFGAVAQPDYVPPEGFSLSWGNEGNFWKRAKNMNKKINQKLYQRKNKKKNRFQEFQAKKAQIENKRIIGGEKSSEGSWPWLVSLQGDIPNIKVLGITLTSKKVYCGGSLINSRWILTAAHCILGKTQGEYGKEPDTWNVRLGGVKLTESFINNAKGILGKLFHKDDWMDWKMEVDRVYVHPEYIAKNHWQNDLALIRLEDPVPIEKDNFPAIQAIDLPEQGDESLPVEGQTCVALGWGCEKNGQTVSQQSKHVYIPVYKSRQCNLLYGIKPATEGDERICAGANDDLHAGICSGDSGGPLVCLKDSKWIQVGIASFTSSKRPDEVPGVFTRVSAYVDWIEDVIKNST